MFHKTWKTSFWAHFGLLKTRFFPLNKKSKQFKGSFFIEFLKTSFWDNFGSSWLKHHRTGFSFKKSGSIVFQVRWNPDLMQKNQKIPMGGSSRFWRKTLQKFTKKQMDKRAQRVFHRTSTLWVQEGLDDKT